MLRQLFNLFVPQKEVIQVTPSQQSAEKNQLSELNYRSFFESMEEGFASCQMIYDTAGKPVDFRYLYVNPAFAKQTGLPVEQVVGRTVRQVIPQIEPFWIETYGRVVQNGKSEHFVNSVVSIGKQFEIKVWRSSEGCFAVVFEDITDRKKTEEIIESKNKELVDLSKSQEETKKAMLNVMEDLAETKAVIETEKVKDEAILASIGDGLVAIGAKGQVVLINQAGCDLLGFKIEELLGKNFIDVVGMVDENGHAIPKDQRPTQMSLIQNKPTTTTTGPTYYYLHKDQTKFPVAITVKPIIFHGKTTGAIEIFRDITYDKEVDKAKTEFVSLASHQLRTPLSTIKWYGEMLLSDKETKLSQQQKGSLEQIYHESKRMIGLVNALLNVSRIELGTFKIDATSVNIRDSAKTVIEEIMPQILEKKLKFDQTYDPSIPTITADPKLLDIIFENLLSNAMRYTPSGGHIRFDLRKQKSDILITVSDTGIGIPRAAQDKIFTKLFRADNVREMDINGTGLGLYTVKAIVDRSGGKIWFESKEGTGTTFYVTLPLSGMLTKQGTKELS